MPHLREKVRLLDYRYRPSQGQATIYQSHLELSYVLDEGAHLITLLP
ncbi:hypothetical protein [Nitrosomonas communis]